MWVTIRACGEVGFRLTAEAEIGRSRFADGPSAVLSIEFQHAVGGGCAVIWGFGFLLTFCLHHLVARLRVREM